MDGNLEASERKKDSEPVNDDLGKNLLDMEPLVECTKIAAGSTGSLPRVHSDSKLAKRQKNVMRAENVDKVIVVSPTKVDTGHPSEGNEEDTGERSGKNIYEEANVDHTGGMSNLRLADGQENVDEFIKGECAAQDLEHSVGKESSLSDSVPHEENLLDLCEDGKSDELSFKVEVSGHGASSGLGDKSAPASDPLKADENVPSSDVKEGECFAWDLRQNPETASTRSIKRKLLILDVNGLLADIVMPAPKDRRGDVHILGRAIFKRPFCDDFLKFCFENFDVAIWSSRSKKVIDKVVNYLLGDLKDKLLFCWDMAHSTQTGFKTLENIHKPLVCKEVKKIWENDPDLPWKKGDYNESNTLLLDDSPYKALLNPKHTAIFPNSFHYHDKDNNSLGPGGDLQVYLEGLLTSENVQSYVEQHPYGQSAINETNSSWEFYSGVLQAMSNQLQENSPGSDSNSISK